MTNLEYFKSQFPADLDLGSDDINTAYAYYHATDKDKFVAGFKEYVENNPAKFEAFDGYKPLIYDVNQFVKWFNEDIISDPEEIRILNAPTWEEYWIARGWEQEIQENKIHLVN